MPAFLFCLCAAWGREGLVQPDRPGDPAFILPHGAGGPGLAEEPGLPGGRLERRLLTAAGRTYPCHTHSSSLCQVCVFSVHPCLIFKSEGSSSLRLEGLLWALLGPPHDPGPWKLTWFFLCVLYLSGSSPSMFPWHLRLWWSSSTSPLLESLFPLS